MVKNRGKRIKTNQQTLDISRLFRFVFIIVYGHINASVMMMLNIPDKYAMERGGWETDAVYKNVYQQTFSRERQEVDKKIDEYFYSQIPK